jgi:hypothetical protein
MGMYVNLDSKGAGIGQSYDDKIESLLKDGAAKIPPPVKWVDDLVCVVDNGAFAAAAYAYDAREMDYFKDTRNTIGRRKQWLMYEHAKTVAK